MCSVVHRFYSQCIECVQINIPAHSMYTAFVTEMGRQLQQNFSTDGNETRFRMWRDRKPTRCNNQMFIINFSLNMFRASLCPSSGEQRPCVTAYGVLRWFCWMWLVAVVGCCVVGCEHCEGYCSTTTTNHIHQNQRSTPHAVTHGLCSPEDGHNDAQNMLRQKLIINIWLLHLVGFLSLHTLLTMHGHRNLKVSECLQNSEGVEFLQIWLGADSILGAVQESPVADVCRIDMESYAAPVQVCRALHSDSFCPSQPKNCETLYTENMPVFYNLGIFTATATNSPVLFMNVVEFIGDRSGTVVKVLCYKSEGRWFDPSWCHRNFSLT